MDEYKFRVEFLEDAKQFLDNLDEKAREKSITIFGKPESRTTRDFLKNFWARFGNFEQSIAKPIIAFLRFGIKPTNKKR